MQKFTNFLHTFSSPFQDAAAYCKAETRSNSFMAIAEESVLTVTVHRSNVLKAADKWQSPPSGVYIESAGQMRSARPFFIDRCVFKYILGCLCRMGFIRYNKNRKEYDNGAYRKLSA